MFESVRSVRPAWIGFGWFIAAALTSLLLFVLSVLGIIRPEAPTEGIGVAVSLLVGFFVAGFFTGTRVNAAPVLHGVGMGLFSLLVWFVLNLFADERFGGAAWDSIPAGIAVSLLGLQTAAAVVGARAGVRFARRASALA
jgi:hypothetical protein